MSRKFGCLAFCLGHLFVMANLLHRVIVLVDQQWALEFGMTDFCGVFLPLVTSATGKPLILTWSDENHSTLVAVVPIAGNEFVFKFKYVSYDIKFR